MAYRGGNKDQWLPRFRAPLPCHRHRRRAPAVAEESLDPHALILNEKPQFDVTPSPRGVKAPPAWKCEALHLQGGSAGIKAAAGCSNRHEPQLATPPCRQLRSCWCPLWTHAQTLAVRILARGHDRHRCRGNLDFPTRAHGEVGSGRTRPVVDRMSRGRGRLVIEAVDAVLRGGKLPTSARRPMRTIHGMKVGSSAAPPQDEGKANQPASRRGRRQASG